jgi:hypothetical protein
MDTTHRAADAHNGSGGALVDASWTIVVVTMALPFAARVTGDYSA